MDVMGWLKRLARGRDEKLAERKLEARSGGTADEHGVVGPGFDAGIGRVAETLEHAEEHREPQ